MISCSLCANKIIIFNYNKTLKDIIYKYLNITVKEENLQNICQNCEDTLINWDDFFKKCWSVQKTLGEKSIKEENGSPEIKIEDNSEAKSSNSEADLKQYKERIIKRRLSSAESFSRKNKRRRIFVEYICHVCKKDFKKWPFLKSHCLEEHSIKAKVLCVCGKYLYSFSTISNHALVHDESRNDNYRCELCRKVFFNPENLNEHTIAHHGTKEDFQFACSQCPKKFFSARNLSLHGSVHLPPELRKKYDCDVCEAKLASKGSLQMHKLRHKNVLNYTCDICGNGFRTKANLKQHKFKHSEERNIKCEKCPKRFKNNADLKKHLECHDEVKYKCPQCPILCNTKRGLRSHELVHSDIFKYSCKYCNKKFKTNERLKRHINSHEGVKLYTCEWCSNKFSTNQNLKFHKQRAHSEKLNDMDKTDINPSIAEHTKSNSADLFPD